MIRTRKRLALRLLALAFLLTLLFVPFRHRTLVTTSEGGFAFDEERVWAPLWGQPTVADGVAEYPFRLLLVEWMVIAAGVVLVAAWRPLHPRAADDEAGADTTTGGVAG